MVERALLVWLKNMSETHSHYLDFYIFCHILANNALITNLKRGEENVRSVGESIYSSLNCFFFFTNTKLFLPVLTAKTVMNSHFYTLAV